MSRKKFSAKERERLFLLHEKKCHICQTEITRGERWDIEHLIPWELTRDDSDENLRPAHVKCHALKTAVDVREIRKADRARQKSFGIKSRKGRSLRHPTLKKKLSGEVVPR